MPARGSACPRRSALLLPLTAALSLALLAIALTGCEKPSGRARRLLAASNIAFTPDDFVDAAGRGDAETVRLFIEAGMDPASLDINGYTALIRAAEQGHTEVVQTLLTAGADPNTQGVEGVTALMQAALFNRLETVRALLAAGADTRPADAKGWTALTKAVYNGHHRVVEAIFPHARNEAAQALALAAVRGHANVLQSLLAAGAPPDAALDKGRTALMLAASRGDEQTVRILLAAGAQPLAADADGNTASMLAAARGHRNLARLLQQAESGRLPEPDAAASSNPPPPPPAPEPAPAAETTSSAPAGETLSQQNQPAPAPEPPSSGQPPAVVLTPEHANSAASAVPAAPPQDAAAPPPAAPTATPAIRLVEYNQERVPLLLTGVRGGIGQFRDDTGAEFYARAGDPVGAGGRFTVVSLRQRQITDKDGSPVDASEARLKDTRTGREHRLVKDLPARASRDSVVLAPRDAPGSRVTVRVGEDFFMPGDPSTLYRLVEARKDAAVIRVVETGETFTITR